MKAIELEMDPIKEEVDPINGGIANRHARSVWLTSKAGAGPITGTGESRCKLF